MYHGIALSSTSTVYETLFPCIKKREPNVNAYHHIVMKILILRYIDTRIRNKYYNSIVTLCHHRNVLQFFEEPHSCNGVFKLKISLFILSSKIFSASQNYSPGNHIDFALPNALSVFITISIMFIIFITISITLKTILIMFLTIS